MRRAILSAPLRARRAFENCLCCHHNFRRGMRLFTSDSLSRELEAWVVDDIPRRDLPKLSSLVASCNSMFKISPLTYLHQCMAKHGARYEVL